MTISKKLLSTAVVLAAVGATAIGGATAASAVAGATGASVQTTVGDAGLDVAVVGEQPDGSLDVALPTGDGEAAPAPADR